MSAIRHDAVVLRPCASLHTNPRNARTHSKRQIAQIADSIGSFGFVNPILIDEDDRVIAGHGRLAAAKKLGHANVPTLRVAGLTAAQKRAYVLADNRLAEKAGWDREMLSVELGELSVLLPTVEVDWNLGVTGFALGEIDILIDDHAERRREPEDEVAVAKGPPVSRPGDLWQLGPHRVLCGDARAGKDVDRVMNGERARMVFTDPPYNVAIAGHVKRKAHRRHSEFAMASGEMDTGAFAAFLETVLGHAARVSVPGAVHDICMDWRSIGLLTGVGERIYEALLNICVWNKGVAGQGSFYRSQHEFVAVFRVGGGAHQNNVELGRHGRNRSNVWTYAAVSRDDPEGAATVALHPTVKPVALVADAMRDCTSKGHLVFEPFLGSGTTLIAAEKIGRRCFGIEIDPVFVDGIIRRYQAYTGRDVILEGDGWTFEEIEAERRQQKPAEPALASKLTPSPSAIPAVTPDAPEEADSAREPAPDPVSPALPPPAPEGSVLAAGTPEATTPKAGMSDADGQS